jgi:dTDP-glucose 4,6-dehydratase
MKDVDMVYHLAALIGIPFSYVSQDTYIDTNVKGTLNILQAAKKFKTQRVIHTSTSEVYGTAQRVPIDESHPINPQSPYAATKVSADYLALSFNKSFNLPVVILRPFNTFGPRQSARAVIPTIITQLLAGKSSIFLGDVNTLRDFNYVQNLVEAFIRAGHDDIVCGEVYNVGSGREVSIREVFDIITKKIKKKAKIIQDKTRLRPAKSEVRQLLCDYEKFRSVCGWAPIVSLEQGLELTCEWMKGHLEKYKPNIYNI